MSKFISITFHEDALSTRAAELLRRARLQNEHLELITRPDDEGKVELDVIDYDSLGSDDTFSVRVKSKLSYKERCLKYGIAGMEPRNAQKDENGHPKRGRGVGSFIPTEEYVDRIIQVYGDNKSGSDDPMYRKTEHAWSLRDASDKAFGLIKGGKVTGNEAFELLAQECQEWCESGEWYVILPRGKDGGRPTINEGKTLSRKNIMISDEDYEYLKQIGGNASAGIREAIAAHREGANIFKAQCTEQWLKLMEDPARWDSFEGRMASVDSFPIGIDWEDPRVKAFGEKMSAHWQFKSPA